MRCYPADLDPCPSCTIDRARLWIETGHSVALPDASPITAGHTVVVPRKHVSTIYELTIIEQQALWDLVADVRARLLTGLMPDGFSIGSMMSTTLRITPPSTLFHGGAAMLPIYVTIFSGSRTISP